MLSTKKAQKVLTGVHNSCTVEKTKGNNMK